MSVESHLWSKPGGLILSKQVSFTKITKHRLPFTSFPPACLCQKKKPPGLSCSCVGKVPVRAKGKGKGTTAAGPSTPRPRYEFLCWGQSGGENVCFCFGAERRPRQVLGPSSGCSTGRSQRLWYPLNPHLSFGNSEQVAQGAGSWRSPERQPPRGGPGPEESCARPALHPGRLVGWCPSCEGCRVFAVSPPVAPEGRRTPFFICIAAELLRSLRTILTPHRLSACLQWVLPVRSPSSFTFYKHVQRNEIIPQEHSNSHWGYQAKRRKAETFDSPYLLNLSLSNQLLLRRIKKKVKQYQTISLTDWKTSLWHSH